MIPQETIEQVAAANDIVELIGSYVPLKRAGSTYKACCPFHQEKTPSFNVNPGRQMFKCFGCGVGGGVFKFITLRENIDFPSAVRRLAERAGIAIVEEGYGSSEEQRGAGDLRRRLLALHAEAAAWFHRNLMKEPGAQHARDYLKKRGLSAEVAARWQLGYAPDSFDALRTWGESRHFKHEEMLKGGLVKVSDKPEGIQGRPARPYDVFRDRLMFPICDEAGSVIAFSGRVLQAEAQGGKYVNSPETPLFNKSKVLFGLHMAKKELIDLGFAIVCEGQIDLITAYEAGIKNVIAPQGTAFTEPQARKLKRYVEEAVLCFDSDAAGQKAAERTTPLLLEANLTVRVVSMPPGEDPDSLIRGQGVMAFAERIAGAQDFFDYQIERLSGTLDLRTPRGKAEFSQRMAEWVSLITEPMLREGVVGKVSARLGVSAQDFRLLLKKRPQGRYKLGPADFRADGAPGAGPAQEPAAAAFEKPSNSVVFLLRLALENEEARAWLLAQPWRELLPQVGGTELLVKALAAEIDVRDLAETSAFLATLPAAEESFLTGQLMEKPFPQPMTVARDSWHDLVRTQLKGRITTLESRMRLPDVTAEETTRLQKEILDLQLGLKDIARL